MEVTQRISAGVVVVVVVVVNDGCARTPQFPRVSFDDDDDDDGRTTTITSSIHPNNNSSTTTDMASITIPRSRSRRVIRGRCSDDDDGTILFMYILIYTYINVYIELDNVVCQSVWPTTTGSPSLVLSAFSCCRQTQMCSSFLSLSLYIEISLSLSFALP
jgi:hypothetical protein